MPLHSSSRRHTWHRRITVLAASVSVAFHAALLLTLRVQVPTPAAPTGVARPTPFLRAVLLESEAASILHAPSPAAIAEATRGDRIANEHEPVAERQQSVLSPEEGKGESPAGADPTTSHPGGEKPLFWRGFRDPRLRIAPPTGHVAGAQRSAQLTLEARFRAARDSLVADMRTIESTLTRGYHPAAGTIRILPEDGRIWETSELLRQNAVFVRDSIRQERVRATRERKDADRNGHPRP